jgi:hypothetical protein
MLGPFVVDVMPDFKALARQDENPVIRIWCRQAIPIVGGPADTLIAAAGIRHRRRAHEDLLSVVPASSISPVAIFITVTPFEITSSGRFWPSVLLAWLTARHNTLKVCDMSTSGVETCKHGKQAPKYVLREIPDPKAVSRATGA